MTAYAPGQIRDDANIESLGAGIGRYADLDVPTLLLAGTRSPKHIRVRLAALAAVVPDVDSLVILPRQGHTANARAPGKVAQVIESFAGRVPQ